MGIHDLALAWLGDSKSASVVAVFVGIFVDKIIMLLCCLCSLHSQRYFHPCQFVNLVWIAKFW